MTPSPNDADVYTALGTFLASILPAGVEVVQAQQNRIPEPAEADFVVVNETRRTRLRTNVDTAGDVKFTGSIAATTMTVTAMATGSGPIEVGATVFGVGVAAGTVVSAQITGAPGGTGTYTVGPSQAVGSETLSAGGKSVEQGTMVVLQLDVHGPNSSDNAQTISTLLRDEYAVQSFADQPSAVVPLHADDPKQIPFINDQSQYETRWVIEAMLQVNPVVRVPQTFADSAVVDVINVEAAYAP